MNTLRVLQTSNINRTITWNPVYQSAINMIHSDKLCFLCSSIPPPKTKNSHACSGTRDEVKAEGIVRRESLHYLLPFFLRPPPVFLRFEAGFGEDLGEA